MSKYNSSRHLIVGLLAVTQAALLASPARADITQSKAMTFDMGLAKINSTITDRLSGQKKRSDTDTKCEGFLLSMICGDMRGGEIVRLDKDVTWRLEPKKKSYMETAFATPEQIAAAKAQRAALLEQLKNCPQPGQSPGADTSKCDMSPPKVEVKKTDETATIAGHQTRRSWVALTQTCNNKSTGEACEYTIRFDVWLTQDTIPGLAEERSFRTAYMHKMGLDEETMASLTPQLQGYFAPYANALKEVGAKAGDLSGFPLKTTVSIEVGGEHCAAAKQKEQQQGGSVTANAADAAGSAAASSTSAVAGAAAQEAVAQSTGGSLAGSIAGSAAGAFGRSMVSGLFNKKKSQQATAPQTQSAPAASPAHVTILSLTTETTSISSDAIPADQFEIPAGWKLVHPKPPREHEAPKCPQAGT